MKQIRILVVSAVAIAAASIAAHAQTPPPDPIQVQAPVYRSGTYVVPVGLTLAYKKEPWIGLTAADVMIVFDKLSIAPIDLQVDDKKPNHYTVFFQPPDAARDGKAHVLQIKLKKPKAKDWTTLPVKTSITLEKSRTLSKLLQ